MLHSVLFKDADMMSSNYIFLSGSQFATIEAAKSTILSLYKSFEFVRTLCEDSPVLTEKLPFNWDINKLESEYFRRQSRYMQAVDNFANWLYKQGYFTSVRLSL